MSLQGMIEEMGLGEIIQALSLNRHIGTLRIEGDEGISKFFYLSEGEIVLIRTVKSEPVRIGELLVRAGKIDHGQLEQALELQKQTKERLGDALIALGHVTAAEVETVVRQKFEEEFLDVFLLDRGHFEFIFGLSPESLFSPDEKLEKISLNTSSLMLEAMRRVDDWQKMQANLGSLDEIYRNRVATLGPRIEDYNLDGVTLPPQLRRDVYELVDGQRTIREVVAASQQQLGASRLAVFQFLHAVKNEDLIRPLDVATCLAAAKEALEQDDASGASKFIRAVMSKERVEIGLVKRFIDFLRKSARPQFAKRECKVLAAQYLASGAIDHAIALYEQALEIDRRDTEVLDRLFYAHLRKSQVAAALEVGFIFRDYMQRESDLPIVARVVKNMKELAPEDARVLELSGLLLKRQERIDEARRELNKALDAYGSSGDPVRREAVLKALCEIDPDQNGLARERDKVAKQILLAEHLRAARRRIIAIVGVGAALAIGFLVFGELRARSEFSQAEEERKVATNIEGKRRAARLYAQASIRISTVGGKAAAAEADLEKEISAELQNVTQLIDAQVRERKDKEDRERKEREVKEAEEKLVALLAAHEGARNHQDWKEVMRTGLEINGGWPKDARAQKARMPIRVITNPPGARVTVEGGSSARTPCVVEGPVRAKVKLKIQKPGFVRQEPVVETNQFNEIELPLVRGAAWRHDVGAPIVGAPAVADDAGVIVVVARDGRVFGIGGEEGNRAWTKAAGRAESVDALGDPVGAGVAQGHALVGGQSGLLLGLDVESGEEKWRIKSEEPILHAPLPVEIEGRERAVVVRGKVLAVVDASKGTIEREVPLPAVPVAAPVSRGSRVVVALVDGRLCAVDAAKGKLAWTSATKVDPAGPPVISSDLGFVVVPSRDGSVVALSLADGTKVYRQSPEMGALEGGIAVDEGKLVLGTSKGRIAGLNATDGRVIWDQVFTSPLGAPAKRFGASLYAPLRSGELLELAPADGRRRFSSPMEGAPTGPPVVWTTKLLVGAGSGVSAFERVEEE